VDALTPPEDESAPRRVRDPDRKGKILAAAADLVAKRGFHAASVAEIGAAVGVSGAAIYRHFESKGALLVALFDRAIDELLRDEHESLQRIRDVPTALRHLIDRQVDFVVDEREFARVYHHEVDHLSGDDRRRLRRKQRLYLQEWVHLVRELHEDLDDAAARTLVHAAIGTIQSPLFHNVGLSDERLKAILRQAAYSVLELEHPGYTTA
jgi:AcrR family transcriptional regulator